MQVHFSTEDLPPRDRVRSWCDYFAKRAHSITPDEIPDPNTFRAEADGHVAGEFALLNIEEGFERVRRTAADVARDKPRRFSSADSAGSRSGEPPHAARRLT
jgi:hypothetical protein